jgi:hypothetical protein
MLSEMEPEELALLADSDFRESVQCEARSLAADAFNTYEEVMSTSDDDAARIAAADRIMKLSGGMEEKAMLPNGVSEEVFKLAIAGLGQLAGIARSSSESSAILRNVTPAANDPRHPSILQAQLIDDSPMNRRLKSEDSNDEIANIIAGERYEIIESKKQF